MSATDSHSEAYWRMKELFAAALDRPPAQREPFLVESCGDDERLLAELRQMLAAHEHAAAAAMATRATAQLPGASPSGAALIGTSIGPYKLLELIGEGGMGVVYKAEQRSPVRRIVALKLIKLGMDTEQVIARFDSERQALAVMNHAHVAAVYDAGATDTGRPYFVMEFVPGTPITSFCDRHKYTTRQRLELFMQACDAIQHAHTKAIIHRDVKPGNILVMLDGDKAVVKVIDFGVAKATAQRLTEQTFFTECGQLIGTPEYMSPEQAERNAVDVDTRSDIYSLGVVLYELLAGALPFEARTLREAAYAQIQAIIREVDPPRPSTRVSTMQPQAAAQLAARHGTQPLALARELRHELEWIPLKAMRKDRTRRYRTAAELSQDVQNYLSDLPLLAGPESTAYRMRKFLRRNKVPALATAAVAAALVAGMVGTTLGLIGQSRQRAEAQRQARDARDQAAIAQAVSQFQSDMLASADPDRMLGERVTVLQATNAAVAELDAGKLAGQPLIEAGVRQTIGNTLRTLGRYDAAETNLRRALELRRGASTADDRHVGACLNDLALLLRDQGKPAQAERLMREALDVYARTATATEDPGLLATGLNNLALVLHEQNKLQDAESLDRQALVLWRKTVPAGDPHIALCVNNLASVLQEQGRLPEAEALLGDALAEDQQYLPPGHPGIARSMNNLGTLFADEQQPAKAEPLFHAALKIYRDALPAGHPLIATSLNNLGLALRSEGRPADAAALFREALDVNQRALPSGHPAIALACNNLALALQDQHQLPEAESLYRRALDIWRDALPAGHPRIAQAMSNLAALVQEQGRLADAEQLCRDALAMREQVLPPGHRDIAISLNNLGGLLRAEGKYADAEPFYRRAVTAFERSGDKDDWLVANARLGLGRVLIGLTRWPEAEALLLAAEPVLATAPAVPPGRHDLCVRALGELYEAWEKAEPGKGADKAKQWRAKFPSIRPATGSSS